MQLTLDNTAGHGRDYSSGECRTLNSYQYGKFETRLKAAKGDGLVSSFFIYLDSPHDEIDIEILGNNTTKIQLNYYTNGVGGHEQLINLGFDASEDYHTYAFEWTQSSIRWYVDGSLVGSATNDIPTHAGKIMMNHWATTSAGWAGDFNNTIGSLPTRAYYDWVKYYTKN